MARPVRCRRISAQPVYRSFIPEDTVADETVRMSVDEFETIILIDYEGLDQKACAEQMGIARTTVTAIYESARHKAAEAFIEGKRLLITGGRCEYVHADAPKGLISKGSADMRIAVAYDSGEIFQHFGRTEKFKLYDVEDGVIKNTQIVDTNGSGHGALAGFLKAAEADALICGGIGRGAQEALAEEGISLYGGVQGSADKAAEAFVSGNLSYDPQVQCDHHGHEHHHGEDCGHHNCGEHKCSGN